MDDELRIKPQINNSEKMNQVRAEEWQVVSVAERY
jgi:hypothetical protein